MSQLDALLERSRKPGAFVTRKRFTLARHKAIEKMREFSLRHPRQYVLELVQAAVFAGATWIAIDIRDDSILVGWVGGKTLDAASLENIFDYLFVDQADLERRHLMQLAVGLNAIYQRKPSVVRIESGDGTVDGTARMELDRGGSVQVGTPEAGLGGTYLYVEFYSGWWERFTSYGTSDEARLIEERCLYTPVPILLNGSAPFGYRANRQVQLFGVTHASQIVQERRSGAVGVVRGNVAPQFRIVVGGVWVGTDDLAELGGGLGGVIADDHLRKTADMSDLVRDERWVRMLHAVQPIATELLRGVRGGNYKAPALPPMPEIREIKREEPGAAAAPPKPVAVKIEGPIQSLGPRPRLSMEDLGKLPAGSPLFWVESGSLHGHGDPFDFPFHVLELSEGEAVWLAETLPSLAISRLATTADFGFVQRILTRRAEIREATTELTVGPASGTLTLRLHVEGSVPYWGRGLTGVPALLRVDGATVSGQRLPLDLGPISLVAQLDEVPDADDLTTAMIRNMLTAAWKLIDTSSRDAATTQLLRAVLAQDARPTFVAKGDARSIDAVLPNDWGDARAKLRAAPLVQTTDGPLSLDGLLELINNDQAATVIDPKDLIELEALEEAFGPGHLHHPSTSRFPLAALVQEGAGWRPVDRLDRARPTTVIGLRDDLAEVTVDHGWRRVLRMAPIEVWTQEEQDPEDLDSGLRALASRLTALVDEPEDHLPETLQSERAQAMMRLALLKLADHRRPTLRATSGAEIAIDHPRLTVSALHGPAVTEDHTVALSFDELRALGAHQGPQTLRFDDAANVWHTLTEQEEGWLLRQEIRVPGVEGWIGLRLPYDPTAAILVETARRLLSLGEVDIAAPCHGLLWARSTTTDLQHAQIELIRLAAVQLYQRLLELLQDPLLPPTHREAGLLHAASFALRTAARKGELPRGTARELAAQVIVTDGQGAKWGSLERWLDLEPSLRPALPDGWQRHYRPEDGDDLDLQDADAMPERLAGRLRAALSALHRDVVVDTQPLRSDPEAPPVRVRPHLSTSLRITIFINGAHPAVELAHREPRVFEMLLIEAARQIAQWRDDSIRFEDLARVLVAQRLSL